MKLNNVINRRNLTVYGFPAFVGLTKKSNKDAYAAVLSTFPPATMLEMGISVYYAPVIPRNSRFCTPEEIIAADLDCNLVRVTAAPEIKPDNDVVIVSRHPGTVASLQGAYPNHVVMDQITADDIKDKTVVGTLPPHLVQFAGRYQSVSIRDFDYARDGEIAGEELEERLVIGAPVTVEVFDWDTCPVCKSEKETYDAFEWNDLLMKSDRDDRLCRVGVCPDCGTVYFSKIWMVENKIMR